MAKLSRRSAFERFVFLDTQVFDGLGLDFEHPQLRRIIELAQQRRYRPLLSAVVQEEVRKHITDKARDVHARIASVQKEARAMRRGLPANFLDPIGDNVLRDSLLERFKSFQRDGNCAMAGHANVSLAEVVEDYFATRAPFQPTSKKKSEFPDAITVKSLKDFAVTHRARLDIVSNDSGLREGSKSIPNARVFEELPTWLQVVSREESEERETLEDFKGRFGEFREVLKKEIEALGFIEDTGADVSSVSAEDVVPVAEYILEYENGSGEIGVDLQVTLDAIFMFAGTETNTGRPAVLRALDKPVVTMSAEFSFDLISPQKWSYALHSVNRGDAVILDTKKLEWDEVEE